MEPHTQIIELFGVPACGKSSMTEYIISNSLLDKVGGKVDMYKDFDKAGNLKKLLSFNITSFFAGLHFLRLFPMNEKRKSMHKSTFLNTAWCRNYQRKYGQYKTILSDHGIIQDFVSWERGDSFNHNPEFELAVRNYLRQEHDVIFVFCDINPAKAFERLSNRGRLKGRLDEMLIEGDKDIIKEIKKERNRFLYLYNILKEYNFKVATIDTSNTIENNAKELVQIVRSFKR